MQHKLPAERWDVNYFDLKGCVKKKVPISRDSFSPQKKVIKISSDIYS